MKHSISFHPNTAHILKTVDNITKKNRKKLNTYQNLLLDWNKRINLVSRDVSRETIREHIRHSLLLSSLPVFKSADLIVDAGTGGGLPGIPLAVAHPRKQFILNDIVSKKIFTVKQLVRELGLVNTQAQNSSIADLGINNSFLLISKHAFKINELYRYTADLPWDTMVFYKSVQIEDELKDIPEKLDISVYDLSKSQKHTFYEGKGLIVVNR